MQSGGTEKVEVTVREEQTLYMDIMFVDSMPFMVSVAAPLGLIQVTDLKGGRNASILHTAFIQHHDTLRNAEYKLKDVYVHGEGGVDAIKDYIRKVAEYNPASGGESYKDYQGEGQGYIMWTTLHPTVISTAMATELRGSIAEYDP